MTHYDVDYSELEGDAKREKALADIANWLGHTKMTELSAMFKQDCPDCTLREMQIACSFAGIQGYPVRAWWETLYPELAAAEKLKEPEELAAD